MLYLNPTQSAVYMADLIFNFNKCCIWISLCIIIPTYFINLTLTSVVFEFKAGKAIPIVLPNLTLTSVVFEYKNTTKHYA